MSERTRQPHTNGFFITADDQYPQMQAEHDQTFARHHEDTSSREEAVIDGMQQLFKNHSLSSRQVISKRSNQTKSGTESSIKHLNGIPEGSQSHHLFFQNPPESAANFRREPPPGHFVTGSH